MIAKPNSTQNEQQKLIHGGEDMKYQGVSVVKNSKCNTWYARPRIEGRQVYISANTQKECYNLLKKALKTKYFNKWQIEYKKETKIKTTFIEWVNKWLGLYKQDVKPTTKMDYKSSLSYLTNLYEVDITKITSLQVLEELNKIPHERRKQKVYELLNNIFNKAVDNDVITKSPLVKIDKPKHKKQNGLALTNVDETTLEQALLNTNEKMFLICLYQGLRKGEMLALTKKDFDLKNKTLTINKSLNIQNQIDETKNDYSNRVMPLFDKTIQLMQNDLNKLDDNARVFDIANQTCHTRFKEIRAKYNLNEKYTIHSLRHTFITNCREKNIPLHIIQKWVGHNIGSSVTSSVYTHARQNAELEFTEIMNKKFNSNSTQ